MKLYHHIAAALLLSWTMLLVTSRAPEAQAASRKNTANAHAQAATTQPHLDEAYRLLRRSHYVLNHACRRLGGHRAEAIKQIELASGELQAAISVDHGTVPAVSESGDISAKPGQVHPYVHDALRQCEEA